MEPIDCQDGETGAEQKHCKESQLRHKFRISGASQSTGHDKLRRLEGLDKSPNPEKFHTDGDTGGILRVKSGKRSAEENEGHTHENGHRHAAAPAASGVSLGHVGSASSEALPHERGGRDREYLSVHHGEGLNVHTYLMGGEFQRPQGCHGFGENQRTDTHHKLLQCRRKADGGDFRYFLTRRTEVIPETHM